MIKNYKMSPLDNRTSGANWSHSLPYELTMIHDGFVMLGRLFLFRTFDQFDHCLLKLSKFA